MAIDSKTFIKKQIENFNSDIDTSDGSAIGSLLINPLSTIIAPVLSEQASILSNMGLLDVENMDKDDLDAVASNFLVTRRQASISTGNIRFYYTSPVAVNIPVDTLISTQEGILFKTTVEFSITSGGMSNNTDEYPLFHTGDIPIESIEAGENSNVLANTIIKLVGSITPAPTKVSNPQAVYGATEPESNTAFKDRLLSVFTNRGLTSAEGIIHVVSSLYPNITKINVKGYGDDEMQRDLVVSGVNVADATKEEDYQYKYSGLFSPPHNPHIAYEDQFTDIDVSSGVTLPSNVNNFVKEFSQHSYEGIYLATDPLFALSQTEDILNDNFNVSGILIEEDWHASDAQLGLDQIMVPNEIRTEGGVKVLGNFFDPTDEDDTPTDFITAQIAILQGVINQLQSVLDPFDQPDEPEGD